MTRLVRLAIVLAAWGTALAGCGSHPGAAHRQSASTPTTIVPPTPMAPPPSSARPAANFAVGVQTRTFVDTTRPTPATSAGSAASTRTLSTTIWYPAAGPDSGADVPDASPAVGAGPFPLVVWGHGWNLAGRDYRSFLHRWASAGYVVAAPNFPSSTSDRRGPGAGPASTDDERSEPGDLSFVATSVIGLGATPGSRLVGLVDGHRVIAAGHSQGAADALAMTFAACCRDPRIVAAVIVAGVELPGIFGAYELATAHVPVLVEQGDQDRYLSVPGARQLFLALASPKYLLVLHGADHDTSKGDAGSGKTRVLDQAVIDFCDRYAKGIDAGDRLARDTSAVGFAELIAAP